MARALLEPGAGRFGARPWFVDAQRGKALRWRMLAFDLKGRAIGGSEWRALLLR